jgi:hypothetical protein
MVCAAMPGPKSLAALVLLALLRPAQAMDKQGSAHGGDVGGDTGGFGISGALMVGTSIYNPTYGARPDNSGLALMRYAAHADVDLLGRRLSIPLDVNLFSDRTLDGIEKLKPTELDLIGGLTSTWGVGRGAVELGARFEHDRSLDRPDGRQSYADVRARYLYSLGSYFPGLGPALHDGDVGGWATLGCFAYNPSYYARPDNTGKAFLRYGLHSEVSGWGDHLALGVDATMFTDRTAPNPLRPSELDLTPELILRHRTVELHLAYERDMPVDRGGLVQHFVYVLGSWSFTLL